MPLPKRRRSQSRQAKRRVKCFISAPNLSVCPQCARPKLPHRICSHCGYYKGKEVVHIEAEKKEEK